MNDKRITGERMSVGIGAALLMATVALAVWPAEAGAGAWSVVRGPWSVGSTAVPLLGAALQSAQTPNTTTQTTPPPRTTDHAPRTTTPPTYNADIRPILAENCFACHGPDSAARKAGLRLDRLADAMGRGAIVPGDVLASSAVRRILLPESDMMHMPPATSHKKLTQAQVSKLLLWIDAGAKYEQHWSYIAPKRPAVPPVKNTKWVRNPIDRFVLARLEKEGLTPAPEADRRTLARRLSLDLTGLPPEPKDVEAFVKDTRPDAYERLVDKYLAMPQWGEHRGRYWLDAARFADTHGIHFDNYREMWSYREWVINALNANMPFDTFTVDQLAGDLLPNPTLEQRIATGFNRSHITSNEGGAIDEEYLVLYTRDRTETASQVFLGSTTGCAVCHDHKFDPFSQKEFYQLAAFFNNTTQRAMDGNISDTPPVVPVPMPQDRPRFEAIKGEIAAAKAALEQRKKDATPDFEKWLASADPNALQGKIPTEGLVAHLPFNEGKGRVVTGTADGKPLTGTTLGTVDPDWDNGAIAEKAYKKKPGVGLEFPTLGDVEGDAAWSVAMWVKLPGDNTGGALIGRMDEGQDYRGWDVWVEGNRIGSHIVNKWPDDALKVITREPLKANKWQHVVISYDGSKKKQGVSIYVDGVRKDTDAQADALKSTIRTKVPLKIGQRNNSAPTEGSAIQDLRLYNRVLTSADAASMGKTARTAYLVAKAHAERVPARGPSAEPAPALSPAEREELFLGYLNTTDPEYRKREATLIALNDEDMQIRRRGTIAFVSQERQEEAMAFLLYRGEYDKRRDKVLPGTPAALPAMPANLPKNRLGLAKWLLLPDHPLTARVTVNRFWQELFGQGIVRSAGDFGIMGELPSHPELLDWMAVEFREGKTIGSPWNIKGFFKMLVTSATYRQAATITPEKKARDPKNILLSRGPRFRMDAEMLRDYALATSGLLVKKIGGPSVKPYQPDGVWEAVAMIGSNTRDYRRDTGENLYRRSMYTFWKRAAPPASMEIFNAPNRETCVVRRERTNTPLQALVTLNDVQFIEAARNLAQKVLLEGGTTDYSRMNYLTERLLARRLTLKERMVADMALGDLLDHYKAHPDDARALITTGESVPTSTVHAYRLAAWTMLANQMLNLDEVLNK